MTSLLVGAIVALIVIVKLTVVLLATLVGFTVVAALLAYLKREQWTKPAYRWARDNSGRWSATPWTPADKPVS